MIFVLECVLLMCRKTDVGLCHKSVTTNRSSSLYCVNIIDDLEGMLSPQKHTMAKVKQP